MPKPEPPTAPLPLRTPATRVVADQLTAARDRWTRTRRRLEELIMGRVQPRRTFTLSGETYHYFAGSYNAAWHNERTVELAIALRYLRRHEGGRVLEVGNVLGHYVPVSHDVVDKYERHAGVRNVDVLEYTTDNGYDLIVSLSTLEHVGWDEDVEEPEKPIRAVSHLVSLLRPGGRLLVTFPLGYNPHVDDALRRRTFDFDDVKFLERVSRSNRWREIAQADLGLVRYAWPFPAANAVAIGLRTRRESGPAPSPSNDEDPPPVVAA
jgi:SAM-dependent methyltransferase